MGIPEIFVIRSITLLCTAKEASVKQTAFTNILLTKLSSKLFYSVTNVFFSRKFSRQSLKAALHFRSQT